MRGNPSRVMLVLASLWCVSAQAAPECSVAALAKATPKGVEVLAAKPDSFEGAGFCRVEGTMQTSGNSLRFALGLPAQWNGKFLFEATGGGAGVIADIRPAVQRGYAAATTDAGHSGTSASDFSFWFNPEQVTDWVHRGVHTATVGTKALVAAYYDRAAAKSYLRGCSNGGRAGLMEAQRYPEDYDGILSAAPAADPGMTTLNWIWLSQTLVDRPLSEDDWNLVGRTVREACDAKDGLKDGLIQDDRRCELPREQLACASDGQSDCLNEAKLKTVERLWNKPVLSDGSVLPPEGRGYEDTMASRAFYVGATRLTLIREMIAARHGTGRELEFRAAEPVPPTGQLLKWLLLGAPSAADMLSVAFAQGILLPGRQIDVRSFDIAKDGAELARQTNALIDLTHRPDLTAFLQRGSKLLLWHGLGDTTLSPTGTYRYFDLAREHAVQGGLAPEAFDQAVRLYTSPTIGHCTGGNGPNEVDLLAALDAWVTQNQTPGALTVVRRDAERRVVRSRLICPMPEEPRYRGEGSIDDAGSFVCAIPPDRVGITGLAPAARQ